MGYLDTNLNHSGDEDRIKLTVSFRKGFVQGFIIKSGHVVNVLLRRKLTKSKKQLQTLQSELPLQFKLKGIVSDFTAVNLSVVLNSAMVLCK